jgi:hypothetical protein
MEPRREEKKTKEPRKEVAKKPKRFRIVRLEERIAPSGGGHGNGLAASGASICSLVCS